MSIRVNDFRWEPGKNDAEYIKLLESSRDEWQKIAQKAIAKLKALSKAQEPSVRCRDCKYGEPDTNGHGEDMVMCQNKLNPIGDGDWLMPPEFFCANGERRESE